MITFLNRRELVSVSDLKQYSDIRRLLIAKGIRNSTKMGGGIGRRGRDGGPARECYTIYVHEKDYDRAMEILHAEMQEKERV